MQLRPQYQNVKISQDGMTLQGLSQSCGLALGGPDEKDLFKLDYDDNEDWQLLQQPPSKGGSIIVGKGLAKVNDDFVFAVTD